MTYKELLCSVTFEEVEPHIVSMYPKFQNSIGWFKLHFDMFRLIEPKHHDNSVCGDVCHIKMNDCKDGTEPHLYAFPIMGEFFEHVSPWRLSSKPTYMPLTLRLQRVVYGILPTTGISENRQRYGQM